MASREAIASKKSFKVPFVSWAAWHNAKDEKLIWSSLAEKTLENYWKLGKVKLCSISAVLGCFLRPGLSDQISQRCPKS